MNMSGAGSDGGSMDAGHADQVKRVTWAGLIANLGLAGGKFLAGTIGHSQAVTADAVHSLSDMSTDLAILLGVRYWTQPADADHPYGHRRLETMVTLSIGVILTAVGVGIMWNALVTMKQVHNAPPGWVAFFAAIVSIICKEALYRWTSAVGKRVRSAALAANAWHHRSDALSSIPAAIAVAMAAISPSWAFVDHVGAVVVSLFIFQAALKIVRPAFAKLIDQGVSAEELARIAAAARSVDGVADAHDLRTRYISCSSIAVDLHVLVDPNMSVRRGHDISEQVRHRILGECPDVVDVVVHLEPDE